MNNLTVAHNIRPFIVVLMALLCIGAAPEQPPSNDLPSPDEVSARKALAAVFPGRIVFDSNRGAGFGIHIVDPATGEIATFADSEFHEMYPDVSPDGKWVVFSRTKSLDKREPGTIWIKQVAGGNERKLADNATFPTFKPDGSAVYFERERKRVMLVELDGGKETEIFPKDHPQWNKFAIVKPQLSPNGQFVAFISQHPRRWSSWYVELASGTSTRVGPGCEPTWFPQSNRIAWVSGRGTLERSGITSFDLASREYGKVQDDGPPRGHEYFPTITDDSRFLLYAAARPKEHKPVTANYQIFVKDLQAGNVVRITFDPHTNRWPRLLPKVDS